MTKKLLVIVSLLLSLVLVGCSNNKTTKTASPTVSPITTNIITTASPQTNITNLTTTNSGDDFVFDQETYLREFNERRDYLIEASIRRYGGGYGDKYMHGLAAVYMNEYIETGDEELFAKVKQHVLKALTDVKNLKEPDCGKIFWSVYFYCLYHEYYDSEMYELAHEVITTTNCYGGKPSTTNHALQFAVACYLANLYFPGEIQTEYGGYDGSGGNDPDPDASKTIKMILRSYPLAGCYECNSDTYFGLHYFPLLAVARCATDENIRNQALQVIENMFFNLAPIWLYGHMAVGKERCYDPYTTECLSGLTNLVLWYYFGGRRDYPTYDELVKSEVHGVGMMLADPFIPNWISIMIANDREYAYDHLESHFYTKSAYNMTVYEFCKSYINRDYGVYSMTTTISKSDYVKYLRGYDRVLWGVDWVSEDGPHAKSNFSIMHWDAPITDNHTSIGTTVYQEVLQNKGTVIGAFDIPAEYDSRYPDYSYPRVVAINIPQNYKAIIDESYKGNMYLHYGNILIGFKLSTSFLYENTDHSYTGDMTKGWFVCEIADADDIEGDTYEDQLSYFASLCEASFRTINYDYTDRTKVEYTSIDGVDMSLKYGGDAAPIESYLNGEKVLYNIQNWPSQSNPWIEAKVGDKVITYTYKNHSITFDFNEHTTTYK